LFYALCLVLSYHDFNVLNVLGDRAGSRSRGRQSDWDSCGSIHQEQLLIPCTSGSKLKDFTLYNGSPELQVPSAEEVEEVESPPKELPPHSITANLDGSDVLPAEACCDNNTPQHSVDLEGMFYRTCIFDDLAACGLTLVHVHSF
jgi:hypothetical protein